MEHRAQHYVPTLLSLTLPFILPASAASQTIDASGRWDVTLRAPTGTYHLKATIRQQGQEVSGPVTGDVRSVWLRGTVQGDEIKAVSEVEFSGNLIPVTLTGKVNGESIKGIAYFAGLPGDWTATRISKAQETVVLFKRNMGVSGMWRLQVKTASATSYPTFELTQEGEALTGQCRASFGAARVTGAIRGREIAFSFQVSTWTSDLMINFTGIVNGNSMTGAVRVGEGGTGTWTAMRTMGTSVSLVKSK